MSAIGHCYPFSRHHQSRDFAPSEGALSRLVGQRPALGDCPPPVPLGLYVLERGLQVGHLLFGPCCPQVQFRIWGWSHWSVRL